ncbi:hypothetical protein COU80_02100 [Candidatus Peregrinibacteria bacterium CG10_big_fil_rev_8_21_14_0_10_55_24]|nr:MAG: hypothetical protein COU80_02100 [Candidatus Peregrinibacteria bacterium CG10_big_fil_rev_8_21_14_0_10_55_24]
MSSDQPETVSTAPLDRIMPQLDASFAKKRLEAQQAAAALTTQAEKQIQDQLRQAVFLIGLSAQRTHAKLHEVFDPKFLPVKDEAAALRCAGEALQTLRREVAADAREDKQQGFGGAMTAREKARDAYPEGSPIARILDHVGWAALGTCEKLEPRPPEARNKVTVLPTDAGRDACEQWDAFSQQRPQAEEKGMDA